MKVLVFDTETTGLPPSRFPVMSSNIDTFPYIVQLSYIVYDTDKHKILHEQNNIIMLPDNVDMSEDVIAVHGISKQLAKNRGIHIESALEIFSLYVQQCKMVVAHNIDFDMTMVEAECLRAKIKYPFTSEKIYYCTMNKTKDLEKKIDNNLLKKKVEYLFMSNALKELKSLKPKFTNKNI